MWRQASLFSKTPVVSEKPTNTSFQVKKQELEKHTLQINKFLHTLNPADEHLPSHHAWMPTINTCLKQLFWPDFQPFSDKLNNDNGMITSLEDGKRFLLCLLKHQDECIAVMVNYYTRQVFPVTVCAPREYFNQTCFDGQLSWQKDETHTRQVYRVFNVLWWQNQRIFFNLDYYVKLQNWFDYSVNIFEFTVEQWLETTKQQVETTSQIICLGNKHGLQFAAQRFFPLEEYDTCWRTKSNTCTAMLMINSQGYYIKYFKALVLLIIQGHYKNKMWSFTLWVDNNNKLIPIQNLLLPHDNLIKTGNLVLDKNKTTFFQYLAECEIVDDNIKFIQWSAHENRPITEKEFLLLQKAHVQNISN